MEAKKNPRADLDRYRGIMLLAGLALALGAAAAAFSYSQPVIRVAEIPTFDGGDTFELPPIPIPEEKKPETRAQPITLPPQILHIVPNGTHITSDPFFVDGTEEGPIVVHRSVPLEEKPVDTGEIFVIVEKMPQFLGGDVAGFRNWVMERLRYPVQAAEMNIQGKVIVSFVIEKDGRLTGIEVLQTPDRLFSDEACRVLALSPQWTPGKQRNTPVRVKYTIPVEFRLSN
ncbi:MAG: TonB family protein [Rikenellaceae bacterium]|jgi:protein TonB|nr:TonB family protein [Rikenellaceae bacterium]